MDTGLCRDAKGHRGNPKPQCHLNRQIRHRPRVRAPHRRANLGSDDLPACRGSRQMPAMARLLPSQLTPTRPPQPSLPWRCRSHVGCGARRRSGSLPAPHSSGRPRPTIVRGCRAGPSRPRASASIQAARRRCRAAVDRRAPETHTPGRGRGRASQCHIPGRFPLSSYSMPDGFSWPRRFVAGTRSWRQQFRVISSALVSRGLPLIRVIFRGVSFRVAARAPA